MTLPTECDLPAPPLPAGPKWTPNQRKIWRELWSSPQASQWDDSCAAAVAMYMCHTLAVLEGTATAWQAQEARHLADRLGLTPQGMLALGWRLPEPGESMPYATVDTNAANVASIAERRARIAAS